MTLTELLEGIEDLSLHDNGCCLHIAVEDFNLEDEDVWSCIKFANDAGHPECAELAKALLKVPFQHRESFLGVRVEYDDRGCGTVHKDPNPWRG